jgi:hypothetical protein
MNTHPSTEPRSGWIWWTCGTAFVIGMVLGWHMIRSRDDRLPVPTSIREFKREELKLDHPFAGDPPAEDVPNRLRFWLYSGRECAGPPVVVAVQSSAFDLSTPWLKTLIDERVSPTSHTCSLKMRGWVFFSSPRTILHLRCQNGYRIRFRNRLGEVRTLERWNDEWTEDSVFGAVVEPGRYEIEIDYYSLGYGRFFGIWGSPQVRFEPAPDS